MTKLIKLYNLNMCRFWYYNYTPLKLLRNKLVPNKNLVLPFLLESTNPTLTQPSPTSPILVGSSICCFSSSKIWRTIITTSTQTLAGSQDPIKTAIYLSLLCPGVPAWAVMAMRSTAQGGKGNTKNI